MNQSFFENSSRPSEREILKRQVKNLYGQAEDIRRLLQRGALDRNPILMDQTALLGKGLIFDEPNELDSEPLDDLERGKFTFDLFISRIDQDLVPSMPTFELEGHSIVSLSLSNQLPPPAEEFKGRQLYCLSFRADPEEDIPLFWNFYFSRDGNWYKKRVIEKYEGEIGHSEEAGSRDIETRDLEIAASGINVLKSYIDKVLSSPQIDSEPSSGE